MNSTQTLPPFTYNKTALTHFWPNHNYRSSIFSHKITIPKIMICDLVDDECVSFLFNTKACFNKNPISDDYNQGPFIDTLRVSIKPLCKNGCTNVSDSFPSSDVKSYDMNFNKSNNVQANVGFSQKCGTGALPTISGGISISRGHSAGINMNMLEFDTKKYQNGEKEIVVFEMSTAYSQGQPRKYDTNDILTLARPRRFRADYLRTPPLCATTSVGANWCLHYKFDNNLTQQFEWSTKVRVVFASNDWNVEKVDNFGENINWITMIHKIVQTFEVTINADKTLSLTLISRKIQRIYSRGYDYVTSKSVVEKDKLEHFNN